MAEVVHHIKGNDYLYRHYRDGGKVHSEYIGPIGSGGKIRKAKHAGGAPPKVTQQEVKQTKEGETINNNKDNSRLEQDAQEKSTMSDETKTQKQYVPEWARDETIKKEKAKLTKKTDSIDRRGTTEILMEMSDDELKAEFQESMKHQEDYVKKHGKPSRTFARKIKRVGEEAKRRGGLK